MRFEPDERDFQHAAILAKAEREFHRTSELFVGHYRSNDEARACPPGWMMLEAIKLASGLKLDPARRWTIGWQGRDRRSTGGARRHGNTGWRMC